MNPVENATLAHEIVPSKNKSGEKSSGIPNCDRQLEEKNKGSIHPRVQCTRKKEAWNKPSPSLEILQVFYIHKALPNV